MRRKNWFTAEELQGLPGLPKVPSSISRKATKEGWIKRQKTGVKGVTYQYCIDSLPLDTKAYLLSQSSVIAPETSSESLTPCTKTIEPVSAKDINFAQEFALVAGYNIDSSVLDALPQTQSLTPTTYIAIRQKWLTDRGLKQPDVAVLWAKGDSMEPTIHCNDSIIVNLTRTNMENGHIYLFRTNYQIIVKRYQSLASAWQLISDNSLYPAIEVGIEEQYQYEVIGQVIWVGKEFSQ